MSEYQYYEFQAIDRRLSAAEQKEVAKLSSRVQLNSTQAIFVYNYGDFRGDAKVILAKYFDAMLYVSNWGTRRLMFRFPKTLVSKKDFVPYCVYEEVSVSSASGYVILDIDFQDEDLASWTEGEGWLQGLLPLRHDIIRGDYRLLYLSWLHSLMWHGNCSTKSEKVLEPPVPPGLTELSEPLVDFIKLVEMDENMVRAAAQSSGFLSEGADSEFEKLIPRLSDEERNGFLLQLLKGENHLDVKLKQRLAELTGGTNTQELDTSSRRSVSELRQLAEAVGSQEAERRRGEEKKLREAKFQELKRDEQKVWNDIASLIETRKTKGYDRAVELLSDLRELAEYSDTEEEYRKRVEAIYSQHSRLSSLCRRMRSVGL